MDEEVWFSLVRFSHQKEEYLMVTNDVQAGDAEISQAYMEDVIDECQFDGPSHWVPAMQDYINEELDHFTIEIFNYNTPCYYMEDELVIRSTYREAIGEFNNAYESIN